jgi:hypothetical protein
MVDREVYHIEALKMLEKDFEDVEKSLKAWPDNIDVLHRS